MPLKCLTGQLCLGALSLHIICHIKALNMVLSWLNYSLNSSQIALLKDAVPATYRDALLSVYMNISLAVIGWLAYKEWNK